MKKLILFLTLFSFQGIGKTITVQTKLPFSKEIAIQKRMVFVP